MQQHNFIVLSRLWAANTVSLVGVNLWKEGERERQNKASRPAWRGARSGRDKKNASGDSGFPTIWEVQLEQLHNTVMIDFLAVPPALASFLFSRTAALVHQGPKLKHTVGQKSQFNQSLRPPLVFVRKCSPRCNRETFNLEPTHFCSKRTKRTYVTLTIKNVLMELLKKC